MYAYHSGSVQIIWCRRRTQLSLWKGFSFQVRLDGRVTVANGDSVYLLARSASACATVGAEPSAASHTLYVEERAVAGVTNGSKAAMDAAAAIRRMWLRTTSCSVRYPWRGTRSLCFV